MTMGVLVVLNNFIHDLAAAMWFSGTLTILLVVRLAQSSFEPGVRQFAKKMYRKLLVITNVSLGIVLGGGVIRAINYKQYEWLPALGRDQVSLLILKHVLLVAIVGLGVWVQVRLTKRIKKL